MMAAMAVMAVTGSQVQPTLTVVEVEAAVVLHRLTAQAKTQGMGLLVQCRRLVALAETVALVEDKGKAAMKTFLVVTETIMVLVTAQVVVLVVRGAWSLTAAQVRPLLAVQLVAYMEVAVVLAAVVSLAAPVSTPVAQVVTVARVSL